MTTTDLRKLRACRLIAHAAREAGLPDETILEIARRLADAAAPTLDAHARHGSWERYTDALVEIVDWILAEHPGALPADLLAAWDARLAEAV